MPAYLKKVEEETDEPQTTIEDLEEVSIDMNDPEKKVLVGTQLTKEEKNELISFLRENKDFFAWSHKDIPGIDPSAAEHKLNIDPRYPPVRQKKRRFAPERNKIVSEEVDRLLEINAIEPCQYPDWLSNVVIVKKKNGKWRVCIDFTNLNKACPKDSFPLPKIDQLVDATTGYERMSFLDAYSGYNQIRMNKKDRIHMAFIAERGLFCYKVMPFGLKNAGATYQRLISKMFFELIETTVEAYIDDMVIKSKKANDHVKDAAKVFEIFRRFRMKLNPLKCAFGVSSR